MLIHWLATEERLGKWTLITCSFSSDPKGHTKTTETFSIQSSGSMAHTKLFYSCFSLWEQQEEDGCQWWFRKTWTWWSIALVYCFSTVKYLSTFGVWLWCAYKAGGVQLLPASQVCNVVPVVIDTLHAAFKVLPPSSKRFPAVRHPPKTQLEGKQKGHRVKLREILNQLPTT